jgi:Protein of unknwon function (DUF3008)
MQTRFQTSLTKFIKHRTEQIFSQGVLELQVLTRGETNACTFKSPAGSAALAAKRGEVPKSELQGASIEMFKSMSESELENLAGTKHSKLPDHVGKKH